MKKVIRLTESDLVHIVKRIINENNNLVNVNSIPCVNKEFTYEVFKLNDPNITKKLRSRLSSSTPKLSKGNIIVYDTTNLWIQKNKWGVAHLYENGQKIGSVNLDNTEIGDRLYSIKEKDYVAQDDDKKFKIGWVMCEDGLYIYDIIGDRI